MTHSKKKGKKQFRCGACNKFLSKQCFNKFKGRVNGIQKSCIKCRVFYNLKWREENPDKRVRDISEWTTAWRKNNPEKASAHNKVYRAVKNSVLKKPKRCSKCKKVKRIYGHHNDYRKPLSVECLFGSCHGRKHAGVLP